MDAGQVSRIEWVEQAAAALFGAAVGYAAYVGLAPLAGQPELSVCALAVAIAAQLGCAFGLKSFANAAPQFRLPSFDVPAVDTSLKSDLPEVASQDELILTDADRVPAEDPLELDDILAELGPDSRVVRLFDPAAMSTPGELKARIDARTSRTAPSVDASAALSEALAELRRSLR